MPDMIEGTLDDVFSLVADETRLEILRALWGERIESDEQNPTVSFSTLRDRVGVRDSGRFNYHLDELVPRFVRQDDDGYALTYAGTQIIGAAVSGIYTQEETSMDPSTVGSCPETDCDGTMTLSYEAGYVDYECDSCTNNYRLHAPPIIVGAHEPEANPDVVRRYALTVIEKSTRGFCHLCGGPLSSSLNREAREQLDSTDHVLVEHECQECGGLSQTSALLEVLDHPALVSMLHDAGIDYRRVFFESQDQLNTVERITQQEPLRIDVIVETADDQLRLVLDDAFDVSEYTRTGAD